MTTDPDMARLAAARPSIAAARISRVLDPVNVVAVLLLIVTWRSRTGWLEFSEVLALVLVGAVGVPKAVLALALRHGLASDRQVVRRQERPVLAAVVLASVVLTVGGLALLHAPRPVFALLVAMATGLLLVLVATLAAKASLHAAVLAGAIPILWLWNPGLGVAVAALLAAVMWARVREGRHSPAQVALGMVLGLIGGLLFPLLA